MFTSGQKVLVNLDIDDDSGLWVPGTIEGCAIGWDGHFRRQYRVRLETPLWDGYQHSSSLDFSDIAMRVE